MNQDERLLNWLDKERIKDKKTLDNYREKIKNEIKGDKNHFKEKKITIWKRILKVLTGY